MLERDHCMKELARNSKTLHGSPRSAPDRPAPYFAPFFTLSSTVDSSSHTLTDLFLRFRADFRQLQHRFLAPFSLHKARVRLRSDRIATWRPRSSLNEI